MVTGTHAKYSSQEDFSRGNLIRLIPRRRKTMTWVQLEQNRGTRHKTTAIETTIGTTPGGERDLRKLSYTKQETQAQKETTDIKAT